MAEAHYGPLTHEFGVVTITQFSTIAITQPPTPALFLLFLLFIISNKSNMTRYASSDTHHRTRIDGD